jgi:hypothetical protein
MKDKKKALRRMNEFGEIITDFLNRKENNYWENYDSVVMCERLIPYINFTLSIHGQCSEKFFLRASLQNKFPHLTFEEIDNGYECEDRMLPVDKRGNEVHQILHPLPIYKKHEIMLFHELNKNYGNDPEILNLKDISADLSKIIKCKGMGFSQEEMIAIIDKAVHSKHPGGPMFGYEPKKKEK